ncbi:uncharacterized protein [Anabrus simplex]|uniref:uncharacterized protein n=1 Tax=Anabrus simplex TaxID=316456 RepID=UPI0034DD28A5
MKFVILLAALCAVAYAGSHNCRCAVFFTSDVSDDHTVYSIPEYFMLSCQPTEPCRMSCLAALTGLTDNGNLEHMTSQNITVRQLACRNYKKDIQNGQLGVYYSTCGNAWQKIRDSKDKVCCKEGASISC